VVFLARQKGSNTNQRGRTPTHYPLNPLMHVNPFT